MNFYIKTDWLCRPHMPAVLQIEAAAFQFPWTEADFVMALRQRNCVGRVIGVGKGVAGYVLYELHKSRIHILNFAIDAECRRQGVGKRLIEHLVAKLHSERRYKIVAEIRESNVAAQLFFRDCGFRAVAILSEFYSDSPGEDAYLFAFSIKKPERNLSCASSS